MRIPRFLLPLLLLAACDIGGLTGPREVAVLGDALIVRAPQGYCVDVNSARGGGDTAALLIGRCTPSGHVQAALLAVTVGRAGSAGVMAVGSEALRAFMSSPAGRGMLARSGRAEDVAVLESGVVNGRLLLHLNDRDEGEYWRAVVGLRGRLVTISAVGAEGSPLPPEEGRKLVDAAVDALIRANPPPKASGAIPPPDPPPPEG